MRRSGIRPLLVAAVAGGLLVPSAVPAFTDGGSRSVFAAGAGNRALAMGGAFVAVADDATALFWNPGGLGRVRRGELALCQTSSPDVGLSEALAAVVWPDWRWGALSASFRHFGIDGIERRDPRNHPIDGDITDSEAEFSLGYGRAIGESWSAGAALKARRQSLGPLSAGGFGLDVGLYGPPASLLGIKGAWAERLGFGLSLGNLVEPSIRLDRESVRDPASLRTGLSYRTGLDGRRGLITTLDWEQPKGGAPRLHAGLEIQPLAAVALRVGMNQRSLTAGTGIQVRGLKLDYSFENSPLEPIHRLGLGMAFGSTVTESRSAAQRKEEDRLQARLAEGFQKRQAEQIESLLASAEARSAERRWDEALELLATIRTLEPNHPRAVTLEASCLLEKGRQLEGAGAYADAVIAYGRVLSIAPGDSAAARGQARCQAESDRRATRRVDVRRQFARAVAAFGADSLVEARRGFQRILAVEPADPDAASMLRRTEEAIGRRTTSLTKQGQRLIQDNRLAQAGSFLDQARELDPEAQSVSQLGTALARARQAAAAEQPEAPAARPQVAPQRAPLTPQKIHELDILYKRGIAAVNERRSDDALRYWELVWSADPDYQHVAEYLKREYLMRGMELFAAGRLEDAVSIWERALEVDPNDQRAIGYLERAQKQLARTREILGTNR